MKGKAIIAAMMLALLFAGTARAAQSAGAPEEALAASAALAVNRFTFDIYKAVASDAPGQNVFLSPYSVSSALAMTYAGARGRTAEEMALVLHFTPEIHKAMGALIGSINSVPEESATVRTANAIWPAAGEKILPDFYMLARLDYRSALKQLDYAGHPEESRDTINRWVEERTNGKITDILPGGAITKDTKTVLTNAVYFKAEWQERFKKTDTAPRPFFTGAAESVSVPTMTRLSSELNYAKVGDAEMIEMPYKGGRFSMLVLLPDKESSVEALGERLNAETLDEWLAAMEPAEVEIFLPRFRQEGAYDLSRTLARLGMPLAFDAAADFSGINGAGGISISGVMHKTFAEVTEEGTEAAAATAVALMRASLPPRGEKIVFRADRPFIYIIRDNESGAALFIGRLSRP